MDDGHRVDYAAEVVAFVQGGIAPADHNNVLTAKEVSVADSAVGHALAGIFVLADRTQFVVTAPGGYDDRFGRVVLAVRMNYFNRFIQIIDTFNLGIFYDGAESGGLIFHHLRQFLPLNSLGESRVVLNLVGDQQLPADTKRFQHHGLHHRPTGIKTGGQSRRSSTKDDNIVFRFHLVVFLLHIPRFFPQSLTLS